MLPPWAWVLFLVISGALSYASGVGLEAYTRGYPPDAILPLRLGLMAVCGLTTFGVGFLLLKFAPHA
jgi:hypothetical protein